MKRIVFLCTGNTCRSPMAEAILKAELKKRGLNEQFRVSSAGLAASSGAPIMPQAKEALKVLGISATRHKSKAFVPRKNDVIIAMTEAHLLRVPLGVNATSIARLTGGNDVNDPYGMDVAVYLATAEYLIYAMDDIIEFILSLA